MSKVTREFDNAGNFEIDEVRYSAIVEMCAEMAVTAEWVDSALFYDWENADDHQAWLDEGEIVDIVNWVNELVASWQ